MTSTTLSPKYQLVIPKQVRKELDIRIGMKFEVIPYGERIELIPIRPMSSLKGVLKGMDTEIIREEDRI